MKSKLIVLMMIFAFATNAMAQLPVDEKTGKVTYTDVIQLEDMTKDEIYKKAKMWVVSTLKSGDNMVELDGSNSDQIVATGNIQLVLDSEKDKTKYILILNEGFLNFKFMIFCKDGRMKYEITNFDLTFTRASPSVPTINTGLEKIVVNDFGGNKTEKFEEYSKAAVDANIKILIAEFINSMKAEEEDDW